MFITLFNLKIGYLASFVLYVHYTTALLVSTEDMYRKYISFRFINKDELLKIVDSVFLLRIARVINTNVHMNLWKDVQSRLTVKVVVKIT